MPFEADTIEEEFTLMRFYMESRSMNRMVLGRIYAIIRRKLLLAEDRLKRLEDLLGFVDEDSAAHLALDFPSELLGQDDLEDDESEPPF